MTVNTHNLMIEEIVELIGSLFKNHSKKIKIHPFLTEELYNVNYQIDSFFSHSDYDSVKPNNIDDEEERKVLINVVEKFCCLWLKSEINSRQCVAQLKYVGNENLASCISYVQIIVRNKKIDFHIVVRSQNFKDNFLYDNLTFCKLMETAHNILGYEVGAIYIKVVSLHINI